MKENILYKLLGFLVFYLTLSPISCYTSSNFEVAAYLLFVFLIVLYSKKYNLHDKGTGREIIRTLFMFFVAFIIPALIFTQAPFVTDVLQWITILIVISLRNECRDKILKITLFLLSYLLLFSLIEYIIGYTTGFSYTLMQSTSHLDVYTQSVFNIYRHNDLTYRFSALTDEPGALGALCGFILAYLPVNKKNLFTLSVCLISGILSLSLAFFVYLSFILLYKTTLGKINYKYIIIIGTLLFVVVAIFRESIQTSIILRLTESERIDNRSSDEVNQFVTHIFDTTDAFYGVGNRKAYSLQEDSVQGNAGLKWKLYQYGIVGCGLYLFAMLLLYNKHRNRTVAYGFGIVFFLMYFYSVGMWGVPLYLLLLFTTPNYQEIKCMKIIKR